MKHPQLLPVLTIAADRCSLCHARLVVCNTDHENLPLTLSVQYGSVVLLQGHIYNGPGSLGITVQEPPGADCEGLIVGSCQRILVQCRAALLKHLRNGAALQKKCRWSAEGFLLDLQAWPSPVLLFRP